MDRSDVIELHYITAIANVSSMLKHGILSHNLADQLGHDSVAMPEIQQRRRNKQIPRARKLHEYANLYFDAHNPMLSRRRDRNNEICVLRIDPAILDLPEVILADQNAASDYVGFWTLADGLKIINRDRVLGRSWIHHNDLIDEWRHKSEKCAEVLVPDRVDPQYIVGAYVANQTALQAIQKLNCGLQVRIRSDMFF